jgi:hypothetical protein
VGEPGKAVVRVGEPGKAVVREDHRPVGGGQVVELGVREPVVNGAGYPATMAFLVLPTVSATIGDSG